MKRKIIYLSFLSILMFSSCQDYLEVQSDSKYDSQFVFQSATEADKAILGAYELLSVESGIHSNRLFYEVTGVGSDIELGPELTSNSLRYNGENLYFKPPTASDNPPDAWNGIYKTIMRCNVIIDAFENNAAYVAADKTKPSTLTHLYGEAVAIRATMYFELTRNWGDVIYFTKPILSDADYKDAVITDRNTIQEAELANLIKVEPMMYKLNSSGSNATTATRMAQEYVQGLIARLALIRGGYALRPPTYTGDGEVLQSHPTRGKMVRRSDYLKYYTLANTYLKKLVYSGNASLVTTDSRTPSNKFSNPFQKVFQDEMDYKISPEMIFEVSQLAGITTDERPYAFGRPSSGGSTAYPPKAYGQMRFFPTYYFGMFDNKDLRRDVTVTTTGLGGVADEKMITFKKGSTTSGGLALNKWDYSRMTDKTNAVKQRVTGINAPYMRLGDMVLLLAETYSVLGDDANARAELLKIRKRAFLPSDPEYTLKTTTYVNGKSGATLLAAIQDERAFELGGEGQRKLDLVRWGLLGKKVNELQAQMTAMADAIRANGSYTFPNGNVISDYIYTKNVTVATSVLTDILTGNCYVTETDPLYPVLFPAWRGTATDWVAPATVTLKKTMLAIKGLFKPLTPAEATAAVTAGYTKVAYGIDLVNDAAKPWEVNKDGVFGGYLPADYTANYSPLYLVAIPATTIQVSGGKISNNYGFPNQ